MKKVITFGTFDIFHEGHKNYLKQAKELGDFLVAVIARDENVSKIKGKTPKNDEQKRKQILKDSKIANEVVLGDLEDKYKIIKEKKPDIIALGYDQQVNLEELEANLKKYGLNAKIIRLEAYKPEIYKSSLMKHGT